jgi:hypothetical protein
MRKIVWGAFGACLILAALEAVRAADQADARAIIDKGIQAVGGADKLSRFKASTAKTKGKFYGLGEGIDFNGETAAQPPHQIKMVSEVDINSMKFARIQVVNGDKGWIRMMETTEEMDKDQFATARQEVYANWITTLLPLKSPEFQLSVVGDAKVGDRPAVGIRVSHKSHRDINLYFDKEKGLLLKAEGQVRDMQSGQEVAQETVFSDYKSVEGIQRPHKITVKREGKLFVEADVEDIQLLDKLDDSVFSKP